MGFGRTHKAQSVFELFVFWFRLNTVVNVIANSEPETALMIEHSVLSVPQAEETRHRYNNVNTT